MPSLSSPATGNALVLGSDACGLTLPSSSASLDLVLISGARGGSIALVSISAFISGLNIVSGIALAAATRYLTSIASPHPFLLCETER
jgi:hypothetical protein